MRNRRGDRDCKRAEAKKKEEEVEKKQGSMSKYSIAAI